MNKIISTEILLITLMIIAVYSHAQNNFSVQNFNKVYF